MKKKRKKCKECGKLFVLYKSTQQVCDYKCALEFNKKKKVKDLANVEKWQKEKKEANNLEAHLKYTKTMVHKYIRDRDQGKPCISCGCQWNSKFEAGHFFPTKYSSIRFDFFNINGQCFQCNNFKEGNHDSYNLKLPDRIGIIEYDKLIKRAALSKKFTKKWTRTELKEIQNNVKLKMREL